VKHAGQPTVILAKTKKGYGMGAPGEALNPTHQTKKLDDDDLRAFRDRFKLPVTTSRRTAQVPFYHPGEKRPEMRTCASAAPRWAATCRSAAARPRDARRCRRWKPSSAC
jgi:pyruvate dehydrogenase complex dehydrogenase (E1) component